MTEHEELEELRAWIKKLFTYDVSGPDRAVADYDRAYIPWHMADLMLNPAVPRAEQPREWMRDVERKPEPTKAEAIEACRAFAKRFTEQVEEHATSGNFVPTGRPAPKVSQEAHDAIRRADDARADIACKAATTRIG
jgi:hypothetical protein